MSTTAHLARTIPVGVTILLGALASPASASPGPAGESPGDHRVLRHYEAAQADDQCDKPMAQRKGNWACPTDRVEQPRDGKARNANVHCQAEGCWHNFSKVHSEHYGSGVFGYGNKFLGNTRFAYEVKLNGAQSISKPVSFSASIAISALTMEGERLYYSTAHPEGNPVKPSTYNFFEAGPAGAGVTKFWTPNGYKAYENTVDWGGVVHQWTWKVSGYPGSWYTYAKSVKFAMTPSSYRFSDEWDIGTEPTGSGYHPLG